MLFNTIRCVLLAAALSFSFAACERSSQGEETAGTTRTQSAFQTRDTAYQLTGDDRGWGVTIPFTFRNTLPDTMYVVNCNGAYSIALEKREGPEWRTAWAPLLDACLSAPIAIAPEGTYNDSVQIWGARPGLNIGPEFMDTTFGGAYRLVWWNVVTRYAPGTGSLGDSIPLARRVSNEFRLRRCPRRRTPN